MNEEFLNGATQEDLDVLTEQVKEASEEIQRIKDKNEIIRANKKEFYEHIENAFTQQFKDINLDRELKVLKSLFNKILKCKTELDATTSDNTITAGYLRKRVEDMVMLIYAFRYLKWNDITKMFQEYGINLEFNPIEEKVNYFAGTNFKETMKEFVDQAIELKTETDGIKSVIEEDLYQKIPASVRFNKQANPAGINKTTFKKFSVLNLLKKFNPFKARAKYENMAREEENKSKAGTLAVSIADTIVSENE